MATNLTLYKTEHKNLILTSDSIIPYMHGTARAKLLDYLDTLDSPLYVNSIFRHTKDQIAKYKKWMEGLNRYGNAQMARANGYIQAARPGWSAHESGRALDCDTHKTSNWEDKKNKLEMYGFYGITTEKWHVHYIDGMKNNEEFVRSTPVEVLTIEEMIQVINKLGYGNIVSFQKDFGLTPDGIIGPNTSLQIRLIDKEVSFVD